MKSKYADYLKALNSGEINAETFAELTINLDKDNAKEAKMKSKGLTPERLERIKQIITEHKNKEMEVCEICAGSVSSCTCQRCFECATLYPESEAIKALNDQDTCAKCADEMGE